MVYQNTVASAKFRLCHTTTLTNVIERDSCTPIITTLSPQNSLTKLTGVSSRMEDLQRRQDGNDGPDFL